jgi:NhaP-type Na+/H+ or K+/H+ antiporter
MEPYILILTGFGALILLTAWLPMLLKEMPLSLPILCVLIGGLLFWFTEPAPHPLEHSVLTERLTEFVVIIALMGAGLKLDSPLSWARHRATWRLLIIAMPLTVLALALLGHALLGLGLASALLLGAVLAPTDPVLASDVQVGPPGSGAEDNVRYTLTSEAGLNDGLAFPFVNLAIVLAAATVTATQLTEWLLVDVLWKLGAGAVIGWLAGRLLGWLIFGLPNRARIARTGDGFVALGVTCLAYGLAEMAHGYGFIAVFVAALRVRAAERNHRYHEKLHDFIEQLERLLMMVLLVLFGGIVASGGLFSALSWEGVAFAVLAIFAVRPIMAWLSLGRALPWDERAVVSFFGIRGLGSAYYLAYALNRGAFEAPELLWSVTGLIALTSILIHGTTVTPIMRRLDRRRAAGEPEDGAETAKAAGSAQDRAAAHQPHACERADGKPARIDRAHVTDAPLVERI